MFYAIEIINGKVAQMKSHMLKTDAQKIAKIWCEENGIDFNLEDDFFSTEDGAYAVQIFMQKLG